MSVTFDLKTLFIILALIALIVLIVYAIFLIRKLMDTLKRTDQILDDVQVLSTIAAERGQDVDRIITSVSGTVADVSDAVKGNQKTITAVASIVNSAASLKGMMSKDKSSDKEK